MDEYFCPNCGAILNEQDGFDPECGAWECADCGTMLMDEETYDGETYEGVAWFCDNCGALLNKQSGFSDIYETWICEECYHTNSITEDDIYDSEDEYQRQKQDEESYCSEDDDYDSYEDDYDDTDEDVPDFKHISQNIQNKRREADLLEEERQEEERVIREKNRAWRRKHRKDIMWCILIALILAIGIGLYLLYQNLIPVRYDCDELVGSNYEDVIDKLESSGFTNVYEREITDLNLDEKEKENLVTDVIIGNRKTFTADTRCFSTTEISVIYHTVETINAPLSTEDVIGMQYNVVMRKFKNNGFVNVKTKIIYDITVGWFAKEGEVKCVTIDGSNEFDTFEKYRGDEEVIITYHDLKKNAPE